MVKFIMLALVKSISIIELANKISDNIEYVAPRDGEARYSCADITKIQSDYDWKPQKTLDEWITKVKIFTMAFNRDSDLLQQQIDSLNKKFRG